MKKAPLSRETLLPPLAAHVLKHGLNGASLRPLAKAAGTSDRMLIYHFGNRQGAVDALLEYLSVLFAAGLEQVLPETRAPTRRETAARILAATNRPELRPFLRLWWEVVAEAARGNAAFHKSAQSTMRMLLDWLAAHMPEDDPDPRGGAKLLLTLIEGSQMLDAVGCGDIASEGLRILQE